MFDLSDFKRAIDADEGFGLKLGLAASLVAALRKWKEDAPGGVNNETPSSAPELTSPRIF